MSGVIEDEGLPWCQLVIKGYYQGFTDCGCVDGHRSCLGGWIRFLADLVSIDWDRVAF